MTSPPDEDAAFRPWTPHQAYSHIRMLRDHVRDYPTAGDEFTVQGVLNFVLTAQEYTACPHAECPCMVLEHTPMPETG